MSAPQPKDTALKTKETAVATPPAATGLAAVPPPPTGTSTATAPKPKATATALTGRKTLTSSRALSLFDQLKNGVNLNSLTIGATAKAKATATAIATATASTPALAPPPVPLPHSNIDLKPPAKPPRQFSQPSSIGIVQGTKRGANGDGAGAAATQSSAVDINALRSQLYQGAAGRGTPAATGGATQGGAAGSAVGATGERGRGTKKRCLDRYDSSESSDR
ncbi:Hypothetical predicted protein [Drosophila guanche]|uniref:Uncharacterized protein n=1 Tax=Drosophila guanche TaxID=7266 RepID=A0A3B0JJC7_DROGU|nr:Hypothetical predicted protein [Drosophila guanche]